MAPFSPSLSRLRELCQKVSSPEELPYARHIGEGCFVAAYKVGCFVVKRTGGEFSSSEEDWQKARAYDIRRAPTVVVVIAGVEYKIQLYRVPVRFVFSDLDWENYCLRNNSWPARLDLHGGNVGVDHRIRFIAFDW